MGSNETLKWRYRKGDEYKRWVKLRNGQTYADSPARWRSFLEQWHLSGRYYRLHFGASNAREGSKLTQFFCVYWFILAESGGCYSVTLSSPWGANGKLGFAAACGAEDLCAVLALDRGLRVREDSANVFALRATYIQEERVGCLDEFLKFVHVFFRDGVRVQKVHFHSD